jgi:hypothetical protein
MRWRWQTERDFQGHARAGNAPLAQLRGLVNLKQGAALLHGQGLDQLLQLLAIALSLRLCENSHAGAALCHIAVRIAVALSEGLQALVQPTAHAVHNQGLCQHAAKGLIGPLH